MIQSTNSHVRRLLNEKTQYEEELQKAREIMKGRMQGILLQCKCNFFLYIRTASSPTQCNKAKWSYLYIIFITI